MATQSGVVNIGNTDANADWLRTPKKRKVEEQIHEELEEQEKRRAMQ
jgi:hypothetical protein